MKHTLFAMLPLLFSPVAHAHPGEHHGTLLDAIVHLLTEPDHLAMAAIAVLAGVVGARLHRRHSQARAQGKRR
jgi:hydrogenase/urease accessory protein HupE